MKKNNYRFVLVNGVVVGEHRVIAERVYGPIPEGRVVNHKNGLKYDNRPENLEIVTKSRNVIHAWETGLRTHYPGKVRTCPECRRRVASKSGLCRTCIDSKKPNASVLFKEIQCSSPLCCHKWFARTENPIRCPVCGYRLKDHRKALETPTNGLLPTVAEHQDADISKLLSEGGL